MQVFLTIFSGVFVFVIGQIFLKLVIEPVQVLKTTISKVAYLLNRYYVISIKATHLIESGILCFF